MAHRSCDPSALARLKRIGGDALARRVVGSFLRTAPERIEALENGRIAGDYDLVVRLAHSLRSSAVNVGANELAALADELELRAAQGPSPRLGELAGRVGPVFEAVREELVVVAEIELDDLDGTR